MKRKQAQFLTGASLGLLGLLFVPIPAPAQDRAFWDQRSKAGPAVAAQMTAIGQPVGAVTIYFQGRRTFIWPEPVFTAAPPLSDYLLGFIRDEKPFFDFRAKHPEEIPADALKEKQAYAQALVNSRNTAPELFGKSAGENRHLTFTHLFNEPDKNRGQIVPLEGRLRRLLRFDAPLEAIDQGVKHVWEGWLFLDRQGTPPVIIHLTELPQGVTEGDKVDHRVKFDGYFFKKYRYLPASNTAATTLLFVGPTMKGLPSEARTEPEGVPFAMGLLYATLGLVGATVVLIGVLTWMFRRADRRIREQLREKRDSRPFDATFLQEGEADLNKVELEADGAAGTPWPPESRPDADPPRGQERQNLPNVGRRK